MTELNETASITRPEELERTPQGLVRRWLAELTAAHRDEKDWREEGKKLWEMYEGGKKKAHAFNVLWANTELLLPAVYNSTPAPDVRRRFRDADPVGKAVSEVLERTLSAAVDEYDFDNEAESMVLDMLLVGRGVLRVKYEPSFDPADDQKLLAESVRCECVGWDDFRRGPGRRWADVPWVAFRDDFTQQMAAEMFGEEIAAKLTYTDGKDADKITDDKPTREVFKSVEVWEIWDREQRRVLFIAPNYAEGPLLVAQDPLRLTEFFPCPRPAYAIKNTRTLVPVPIYRLYEEQAKELDRVSARINKIVEALKVRGVYSANLPEVSSLLEADDRTMIPVSNVSEVASVGGLDNAIWMMPVDRLKQVLDGLYVARDQTKAAIYELTGLSDIVRGASDPGETASAQKIKAQYGSLRLQRLQRETERAIRDVMRLKAEVIAERFSPETFEAVTNLDFPTMAEKQQLQMQMQSMAQQAQMQPGAPAPQMPPELLEVLERPTWEELMQVLRSDKLRQYRVDVETDSTVAETVDRDMSGLSEAITAVGDILAGVQQGLPVDVAKEVALAVTRRARLGGAIEDALEKLDQTMAPPAQPAEAEQPDGAEDAEGEAEKQAAVQFAEDARAGFEQLAQGQQQTAQMVAQIGQMAAQIGAGLQQSAQMVAQIGEGLQAMQAEGAGAGVEAQQAFASLEQQFAALADMLSRPKAIQFTRDANGRIAGAQASVQ